MKSKNIPPEKWFLNKMNLDSDDNEEIFKIQYSVNDIINFIDEYMNNEPLLIAVVCFDYNDFLAWRNRNAHKFDLSSYNKKNQFRDDKTNTTYHAVYDLKQLHSYTVNDYIITKNAVYNKEYERIINYILITLKKLK